jgi:hypothetical protein
LGHTPPRTTVPTIQKRFITETRRARRYTEKKGSGFSGWKDDQDGRIEERRPGENPVERMGTKG